MQRYLMSKQVVHIVTTMSVRVNDDFNTSINKPFTFTVNHSTALTYRYVFLPPELASSDARMKTDNRTTFFRPCCTWVIRPDPTVRATNKQKVANALKSTVF